MLCLYYCAVTAQCHSWICSVFSIAPVKRSSCVGKEERILPLNRESAILMWQHLNQVWVQWAFSYKSWVYIFCNAAKSLLPKRRTWKLISFPLLPLLQGPVGVPGLWAQQCRRHPAPPQAPRLPALRTPLRRARSQPSRSAVPLEARGRISVIPSANIRGKSVALFQHVRVWESG